MSLARGIVLASAGTELVIQATAADVRKYAKGADVNVVTRGGDVKAWWVEDRFLYDREGNPVVFVEEIVMRHHRLETTSMYGVGTSYVSGLPPSYEVRARGPV